MELIASSVKRPLMNSRWPTILMYHAIGSATKDPNKVVTSPESFEAQMRYLKRCNLRGVSMRELNRAVSVGDTKGLVGLTFDDGYENNLQYALPILERLGFSATVFVLGGMLGKENNWQHRFEPRLRMRLLGVEGIREISARGMEVGAHGMTHSKLSGMEAELLEEEVSGSRQILCEILGETVEGFSYPYGALDIAAVQAVRRAGYSYACATHTRVERNSYDLARIPMSWDDPLKLAVKLRIHPQFIALKKRLKPADFAWP